MKSVILRTEEGGFPLVIDLLCRQHYLLEGKTGSGKSLLAAMLLWIALMNGLNVAVLDVSKSDGTGSFSEFTRQLGGVYRDLKAGGNPLEPPTTWQIDDEALSDFKTGIINLLRTMVGEGGNDVPIANAILRKAVSAFYSDAAIIQRWQMALAAGLETSQWSKQPTLRDLTPFLTPSILGDRYGERAKEVCARLLLKLEGWLEHPLGQSLCRPRTYHPDAHLVVYPLQSLSDEEAPIIAQRILTEVWRNSLNHIETFFFCDEIPVLIRHPAIADTIADLISTGRKNFLRVALASQDPTSIAQSPRSAQILDNLSVRFTGVIEPNAIPSFERILGYPAELLQPCSQRSFYPSKSGIFSRWLVDQDRFLTPARFYPNYLLLALCANNPEEMSARRQLLDAFPDDPTTAMTTFTRLLVQSFRSDTPIDHLVNNWLITAQSSISPIR